MKCNPLSPSLCLYPAFLLIFPSVLPHCISSLSFLTSFSCFCLFHTSASSRLLFHQLFLTCYFLLPPPPSFPLFLFIGLSLISPSTSYIFAQRRLPSVLPHCRLDFSGSLSLHQSHSRCLMHRSASAFLMLSLSLHHQNDLSGFFSPSKNDK